MKKSTKNKLQEITDAIDGDDLSTARELINKLLTEVGYFPELQELISTVDRLRMLKSDW